MNMSSSSSTCSSPILWLVGWLTEMVLKSGYCLSDQLQIVALHSFSKPTFKLQLSTFKILSHYRYFSSSKCHLLSSSDWSCLQIVLLGHSIRDVNSIRPGPIPYFTQHNVHIPTREQPVLPPKKFWCTVLDLFYTFVTSYPWRLSFSFFFIHFIHISHLSNNFSQCLI